MKHRLPSVVRLALPAAPLAVALGLLQVSTAAQDRLKTMPGYQQYQKMLQAIPGAVKLGSLGVTWSPDGKSFEYFNDGKRYRFDVSTRTAAEIGIAEAPAGREGRGGGGRGTAGAPERGRQFDSAPSPDGKQKAFYRDRNLWVSDADGASEVAVTTDGSEKDRIKYGTASWVYGEELGQRTAMWWSPDSRRIAYYRFDEKQVPDYYLQVDQTQIQSKDDVEAYPKAGAPNPIVDLFVYDVASKKSTKVDVRDGKPFDNDVVGHYVYRVAWSPDGTELLFNRTNRRQNILEFAAANPETGADPRDRPRGMADRLDREQPVDDVPQGRPALHLGIGAQRLEQLLSLRSERQADRAADVAHRLRGRIAPEGRRSRGRHLLHRARRRQLHEAAAAPRRARRHEGRAADRPGVQPHRRRMHGNRRRRRRTRRIRRPWRRLRHLAGQRVLRRRLPDARHAAGDAARRCQREGRRGACEERPRRSSRSSASRRPRCSPTRRPTARRRCTG